MLEHMSSTGSRLTLDALSTPRSAADLPAWQRPDYLRAPVGSVGTGSARSSPLKPKPPGAVLGVCLRCPQVP